MSHESVIVSVQIKGDSSQRADLDHLLTGESLGGLKCLDASIAPHEQAVAYDQEFLGQVYAASYAATGSTPPPEPQPTLGEDFTIPSMLISVDVASGLTGDTIERAGYLQGGSIAGNYP